MIGRSKRKDKPDVEVHDITTGSIMDGVKDAENELREKIAEALNIPESMFPVGEFPPIDWKPEDFFEEICKEDKRKMNEDMWRQEYQGVFVESDCLHDQCEECHGRGTKKNGEACVHMISCPCKKCTPYSM